MRVGGLGSACAVGLAALAFSELDAFAVLSLALLTAANAAYLGHQALAQADLQAGRVVRGDIARGLVLPLALVVAVVLGATSVATVSLAHALGLLAAVVMLARARHDLPAGGTTRLRELVPLARYGVPVGLWLVTTLANAQLGRVVLEACDMPEALAMYAALHEVVVKAGTLVLMPVVYATQSHVMAAWADGDRPAVRRALRRAFVLQLGAGLVLCVGFALGADRLAMLLFGTAPPGGTPLPIAAALGLGVVLANLGLLAHKGLELGKRTPVMLALAVAAVALGLALSVTLVPPLGALGAAIAYALAQAFYAAAAYVCSRRVLARLHV
jgi:O-antigen/teichoic acid export membrane protein